MTDMNEGERVRYVGTLPNGPARIIEVGDGRAIVDLEGTGRVECAVADLEPLYATATEQAVAGAQWIKQNYGGTDPGGSSG